MGFSGGGGLCLVETVTGKNAYHGFQRGGVLFVAETVTHSGKGERSNCCGANNSPRSAADFLGGWRRGTGA